jgi:hypothetical protein
MANAFAFFSAPTAERVAGHPGGLSDVLDELTHNVNRDSDLAGVRFGVLLSAVGRRSYGPLLLIVGLFAISPATIVPGMTSVTALVTLLIAIQMGLGLKRPWLPKRVLDIKVPRRALFEFLDRASPVIDRMDGVWLQPRLTFLTVPLFVNLVAVCVAAAALITLPLSLIPFAPLAPGIAVVLFGLGMTARDGVWLSVGIALTAAAFWVALPLIL